MSSSGPPYLVSYGAQVGGQPTVAVDIPISASLLACFVALAAVHMTIFQINRRREHKFLFSALLFGLSMARISALTMRIVWATRPTNISIAIAANILTQAGVVILFIVNLFFAQRILRAYHPKFGWHQATRIVFRFLVACVILCIVMVIICTVQSFYTLDTNSRRIDRDVQLFAGTFMALLAFIPAPVAIFAWLVPGKERLEKFGQGRFRTKMALLIFTSLLLTLGAGFRIGTNFNPAPLTDPAWYDNKACFYTLNFGIEIIVSTLYAAARFDKRFHVPNNSKGPGDYANGAKKTAGLPVNTEEDVFGAEDSSDETVVETRRPTEEDWEARFKREQESGFGEAA
jgi:hypothetical protein